MFLFQESLSLIIRRLSFNSITIFLLPMGSHLSPTLANAFLVYYKKIGYKVFHMNIDHFTIEGTLTIYLFYLIHHNI